MSSDTYHMQLVPIFEEDDNKTITGAAYANYKKPADWSKFVDKVLSNGGDKVVFAPDDDLDKIMARGKVFNGKSKFIQMRASACHRNSAIFWDNYTEEHGKGSASIVTGWALSSDGYWRQHTWILLKAGKGDVSGNKDVLVETTTKRTKYFGYEMTEAEAEEFYDDNN